MVFTNLECWAVGGGAAENPQLMEHINLSGNNAAANPFNPQQQVAAGGVVGGAGVAAKVTNGYYGYSYIHAAHAAENINSASADAAAAAACDTNNNESNNNNNNNDRYYAGDYNTALKHTAEYGMQLMQNYVVFDEKDAAAATATLKRTRMDDDDRDNEKCAQERERVDFIAYAAEAAKLNREYALKRRPLLLQQSSLDAAVYYSGEESPIPTKRSRCGADVNGGDGGNEFIAAQYINDFFNMPAFQEQQQQQQQLQQPQSNMMEMDSDMPAAPPVPELQAPSQEQQQQQQQQQAPYEQHYQANGIINTENKTQCINGNALWQQQQQIDSNSTFTGNVTNKNSCCSLKQQQKQNNFVVNGKCRSSASERSDTQLAALFFETHGGCIYNAEF